METTLFNQPHEGNMDASEEIVPLSKIEDQNNESIMKIICKKAKCDEFRRHNKNIEEDDGAQLRKYMQEGDEIVAQIGVGNENDAESFMISGKKLTDDLFSHTHIESQMNPSYAKVIPLVNSDSPKMPTPAFSPDIVAQATKLDTPGLLSPSELIIENGNNKTLLSGEKVSLLQKVPNEADKNIFEEGVLRKLTSKTDDFSSSLGNNKSELDQNEGFRGVKGHHEPSKSLFEALKIISSDPLLRVSQVEIAKSKLKLAKPIQVAVHQTEQNCDCQLFIKIIKTPGCMEFCKAKVLYEEQLRQLKNHSIGGTTEVDNKISTLLYDEASGDTITPDQLLAHKDLSNGSLPEQNLTTNTDQSNIKPLDTKMTAKNSEPNILTAFHNSSLARNNSNLSLNKKSGANSTMENLLTETNNALPLESKLKEQKATIGLNSKKKVDPKTSSRSFKLKSVKNTNEDQHDLDSLTEVLLKPTLLETNHHGTNHREKVILLSENKIPLISSSLSPLEIVDQAKRLQPDHIDADLSTDIVQELLKNSHPIKFPPSKKTHFNIHSLNKILHSSGPVIIENGDSNILEEDDDKSSPEIIKEINDEGGKEEDLVYDDDEDVDDHNDDQDDDDEKEYLSSVRARPLKGIDVSLMHTNYAEEHGSVKTIISNDESSNEEQNKEENDKLIGYKHHSFEDGSNFWLPEVIHHERNSSTQFQCVNGGVSVPVSKFDTQCMCPHQFYGKTCKDWNFCYPNPCSNGGQCQMISEIPKFKCHCKKAYIGHTCSEFNPCDPNPCNNNGVCSHDGKTATCTCTSRFKGENCAELSNCYPNPCKNNGRCVDMEGRFKCECQHGFIGKICEENDMCATNVCQNGGQCIVNGTSYSCQCTQGFVGRICQDRVCSPNPCHHGGICIQRENSMYACLCPSWAAGATCEDVSPCRMNPCKNGARCIDAMSGFRWTLKPMQYFCDCKPPFKGAHCEKNACSECHVDASCDADRCVCNFGFYGDGKTCNRKNHSEVIEVKPCQPNPCMNDGECFVKPGLLYECQCKAPFVPPNCAETDPCKPNPCGIHEKCEFKNNIITCNCAGDLHEKNCGDNLCRSNACYNRGVCTPAGENAFMCSCEGKWGGSRCRECNCPKSQSKNSPSSWCDAKGRCQCPAGFFFDESKNMCAKKKELLMKHYKACQSNPCMNSIVCLNDDNGVYTCICLPDWYGKNCQYRRKCLANPCYNGGTCMEKDGVFLGCVCLPEYLPPLCKTKAPTACHPSPCQNDAVCTPHSSGGYDCICPQRYTGPHCTIDRCRDCDAHAFCANGKCICIDGYVGSGYECVPKGCPTQCLHFQTCIENQCRCIPGHREIAKICIPITELQISEDGMVKPTSSSADLLLKTTLSQFLISKNTRHAAFFPTKFSIMTSQTPTVNSANDDHQEPSLQSGTKIHTIKKPLSIKKLMRPPGNPTPTSIPLLNNEAAEESRRKKSKKLKSHAQVLNKFRALFQSQDAKTSAEAKKQEMLLSALLDMPSLMIQEIADLNERNLHVSNYDISKTSDNSSKNSTFSKSLSSEFSVKTPKISDLLTLKEKKNNSLTVKNRKDSFGNFELTNKLHNLQKNSSNLDSILNNDKTSFIQHIKLNIKNTLKKSGSNIITSNTKNMFQNNGMSDEAIPDKEDVKTNNVQKGVETNGLLKIDTKNKDLADKKEGATADSITSSAANATNILAHYRNNTTPISSNVEQDSYTGALTQTKIPLNLTRKVLTENCIIDPGCVEKFINISKLKESEDKNEQIPLTEIKNDGEDLEELGLKKPNKHMHFLKNNEDLPKSSGFEGVHNVLERNNDVLQTTYFKTNEETRPKIKQSADKAEEMIDYKHGKFQDNEDKNLFKFLSLVEKRLKFKPFHKIHASQPIIPPWMKIETEENPKIIFLAGTDTNITEMRGILKHNILKNSQYKSFENPGDLKDFLPYFDILSLKSTEKRKNLQNKPVGVPNQPTSFRHNFNKNYQGYEQSNSNYEEEDNFYNGMKKHKKKRKKKVKTYQIYL